MNNFVFSQDPILYGSTIPQYQQAIQKWTVIDLEKLTCANIHHLNYIVLWNKDDIDLFISNYIKI